MSVSVSEVQLNFLCNFLLPSGDNKPLTPACDSFPSKIYFEISCDSAGMSLPHRFKAGASTGPGGTMSVGGPVHHHRSTTKVDHKPFKSRHASNRELKDQAKGKRV